MGAQKADGDHWVSGREVVLGILGPPKSNYRNLINQVEKSKTIGLKGLEDETFRICNAVGRWPGEFYLKIHFREG